MAGLMGKFKNILKQPEDDMDYDDFYGAQEEEQDVSEAAPSNDDDFDLDSIKTDDAVEPAPDNQDSNKVQFVLFKPETFDKDITAMADEFIKRHTVILNMEQTNKDVGKRIIDFLSGVAYAHRGKISRVAEDTYIVMPSNVRLSGEDIMDEVESDNIYF